LTKPSGVGVAYFVWMLGWVITTPQAERFSDNPLHKKKLPLNGGWKSINCSSPRRILTKPSGGGGVHGVRKAPVHSAGLSPRHRPSNLQKPPDTYVCAPNRKREEC
jgi:hypothetical protein